jgi:hypothetical protein
LGEARNWTQEWTRQVTQASAFERDGYVVLRNALPRPEVLELRQQIDLLARGSAQSPAADAQLLARRIAVPWRAPFRPASATWLPSNRAIASFCISVSCTALRRFTGRSSRSTWPTDLTTCTRNANGNTIVTGVPIGRKAVCLLTWRDACELPSCRSAPTRELAG